MFKEATNEISVVRKPKEVSRMRVQPGCEKNDNGIIIVFLFVNIKNFEILKTWRVSPKGIYSFIHQNLTLTRC